LIGQTPLARPSIACSVNQIRRCEPGGIGIAGSRTYETLMMDEKTLTAAVSQFLKNVNLTAQRELEKAVRKAIASGKLKGDDIVTAGVTLSSETLDLNVTIYSKIDLQ
jgi:hypothetical protein